MNWPLILQIPVALVLCVVWVVTWPVAALHNLAGKWLGLDEL